MKGAQVRATKGSIGHVEAFQLCGRTLNHLEDLDRYPTTRRPRATTPPQYYEGV